MHTNRSTSRTFRRLALALAMAVVGSLFTATQAGASDFVTRWVYADKANQPIGVAYKPAHNERGSVRSNTVTRTAVGKYKVLIPGSARPAGNVQVTAMDSGASSCQVRNWGPAGANEQIEVWCFDAAGKLVNAKFNAHFQYSTHTDSRSRLSHAYFWANHARADHTPAHVYTNNGQAPFVDRTSTGNYTVTIPSPRGAPVNQVAHVTAFGNSPARCRVSTLDRLATSLRAKVVCATPAGRAVDTRFTFHFGPRGHGIDAWVHANRPTATSYRAGSLAWGPDSNAFTLTRTATGTYRITLPPTKSGASVLGDSLSGMPLVTANGPAAGHCKPTSWGKTRSGAYFFDVKCYAPSGLRADLPFSLTYLGPVPIL